MTNFETLLLKSGSPELILAYMKDNKKSLSSDFMRNYSIYVERIEKGLKEAVNFNPFEMEITEFLEVYGRGILSTTIKTRISRCIQDYVHVNYTGVYTPTVQHLLKIKKDELSRQRNLGPKSLKQLEKVMEKAGLQLRN